MSTPEALARVRIDKMLCDAGWVVPQDPNDEPASVLMERIRAERANGSDAARTRRKRSQQPALL